MTTTTGTDPHGGATQSAPDIGVRARQADLPRRAGSAGTPDTRRPIEGGSARRCGGCDVCCTLPDIPELKKPLDTPCRFLRSGRGGVGCSRYETRPAVCREYRCGWLDGLGEDEDRPDRLGIMWQPLQLKDGRPGLGFVEVRPGALGSARAQDYLERFAAKKPGQIFVRPARHPAFMSVLLRVNGEERPAPGETGWRAYEPARSPAAAAAAA